MAPLVAEFARRYPGIAFDFDLTPHRVAPVTEPYDVAIRMCELTDSNLVARLLAHLSVQVHASPLYLERSGKSTIPSELTLCFPASTQTSA